MPPEGSVGASEGWVGAVVGAVVSVGSVCGSVGWANRAGILIGKGYSAEAAIAEIGMVVEGINAIPAALGLMERYHVEMPLVSAANAIIREGADPREIVGRLMCRENKNEALDF